MADVKMSDADKQRMAAFMRMDDFLTSAITALQEDYPALADRIRGQHTIMSRPLCETCPMAAGWRTEPRQAWRFLVAVASGEHVLQCPESEVPADADGDREACDAMRPMAMLSRRRLLELVRDGVREGWGRSLSEDETEPFLTDLLRMMRMRAEAAE